MYAHAKDQKSAWRSSERMTQLAVGVVIALAAIPASAQQATELPPVFRAADLLSSAEEVGPAHQVAEAVYNNGVLNRYELLTTQGAYNVVGTRLLEVRLRELDAWQRMESFKRSKAFGDSFVNAVKAPLQGAKSLITSPIETTKGAVKGVGSLFSNVGHALFGGASEYESGAVKRSLGFDSMKRKFAFEFGVDPYTSFPPVRERLDEIAWSATAAGLTVRVATAAIPGPAKTAVKLPAFARGMNLLLRDKTPAELKALNGEKLATMNVHESLAEVFLEHPKYSPSHKTYVVGALERLSNVSDRAVFIQRATLDQDEFIVFFRQQQALMMAGYHENVAKVAKIVKLGQVPFMMRPDGVLIGVFPVDHLAWTQEIASADNAALQAIAKRKDVTGGELWFEGSVSDLARERLEAQNWVVRANAGPELKLK